MRKFCLILWSLFASSALFAANAPQFHRFPALGITVPPAQRASLEQATANLGKEIDSLRTALKDKPELLDLLPDVQIYQNAVRYALVQSVFYRTNEFGEANTLLNYGLDRARQLREGNPRWISETGLVLRGYVSRIDGSVQPYSLVVPSTYQPGQKQPHPLDFWFHGRDERLTELKFIYQRQLKAESPFLPTNSFVLHPYGRFCNASKFAGEVDAFEALAHAAKHYPIDMNRLTVRGFSMGGATVWQMATHYAGLWAAATPGAGFAETPIFVNIFSRPPSPTWFEQKLWHLYNSTDYAGNLFNCPTIAYSGEKDGQKQSADLMEKVMADEGLKLTRVIGAGMGHRYDDASIQIIGEKMDALVAKGRNPIPNKVQFTTYTLAYNQMLWVIVDGLEKQWEKATVNAEIVDKNTIRIKTENVSAFTLSMAAGLCPLDAKKTPKVIVDIRELGTPQVAADRSWTASFHKQDGQWESGTLPANILRKKPGLQGPIDDAFQDSFIMVRPTGRALNTQTGEWVNNEMNHAIGQWWLQFRGEARVKDDATITDDDIQNSNLILWGDPNSNKVLARILDRLPLRWHERGVMLGEQLLPPNRYIPVMIFPNPLNPRRYVVLNSGFTFSETGARNNALQVPTLPDFAIIDMTVPPAKRPSEGVLFAGFFDEAWKPIAPPQPTAPTTPPATQ